MDKPKPGLDRRAFLRTAGGAAVALGAGIIPRAGEFIGQNSEALAGDVPANFDLQQGIEMLWKLSLEKKREVVQTYVKYADGKLPGGQWIPVTTGKTSADFIHGTSHDYDAIDRNRPIGYLLDMHTHIGWKASPLSSTDIFTASQLYEGLPYWIPAEKVYKAAKAMSGIHVSRWLSEEEITRLATDTLGREAGKETEHREALLELRRRRSVHRQVKEYAHQLIGKVPEATLRDSLVALSHWHDDVLTVIFGRVRVPLVRGSIQSILAGTLNNQQKERALSILSWVLTRAVDILHLARPESTSPISHIKYNAEKLPLASRHSEIYSFINDKEINRRLQVKQNLSSTVHFGDEYEKAWKAYGSGPHSKQTDEEIWRANTRGKQGLVAAANRLGFDMQFIPNRDIPALADRLLGNTPQ